MGPIWGRQDPDGTHVGPLNFAIMDILSIIEIEIGQLYKYNRMHWNIFLCNKMLSLRRTFT